MYVPVSTYATGKCKDGLTCIDSINISLASLDVYLLTV